MMRLNDAWFEAEFYGSATAKEHRRQGASIEGAQGLFCYCPCAYGNDQRAHGLLVPFANPRNAPQLPPDHGPLDSRNPDGPRPRWQMSGTGLADLTLSPSVDVGCWHGHIENGEVKP